MSSALESISQAVRNCPRPSGKQRRVPESLRRRTVALLENHTWKEVCSAVGISNSQLGTWRLNCLGRGKATVAIRRKRQPAAKFVELPAAVREDTAAEDSIELRMPNGVVLSARGENAINALATIAGSLVSASVKS